ncbi:MAG: ABC transporter permease [Firmicutes bacterium]|nr:ABC transporter permease [Bacillota bacterium]
MNWYALSGSIEQGLAYGILALGVYLTFRVLSFADLTVEGSFPLGAAVAATLIVNGAHPLTATSVAVLAGMAAGSMTALLHTKMRITGLLAGILTMTSLYSINLRIMGRPNVPLLREPTVFKQLVQLGFDHPYQSLIVFTVLAVLIKLLIDWFLSTEIGLSMRATGDNQTMIRSLGVSTDLMIVMGLAFSNGLVALAGALIAQYQGYADVGMGLGTIVSGLASVILGNALIRPTTVFRATLGVLTGSVLYRLAIFYALRAGFAPTDLRIVTAAIVVLALAAPTIRESLNQRRVRWRLRRMELEGDELARVEHQESV